MSIIDDETAVMLWLIEEAGATRNPDGSWNMTVDAVSRLAAKLSAHARTAPN